MRLLGQLTLAKETSYTLTEYMPPFLYCTNVDIFHGQGFPKRRDREPVFNMPYGQQHRSCRHSFSTYSTPSIPN
jgi:hypothetical protein